MIGGEGRNIPVKLFVYLTVHNGPIEEKHKGNIELCPVYINGKKVNIDDIIHAYTVAKAYHVAIAGKSGLWMRVFVIQ